MINVTTGTIFDKLSRLRINFRGPNAAGNEGKEEPFRSELYSSEQLDKHARLLAMTHKLMPRKPADRLLKRLGENEKILLEVRNLLVDSIRSGQTITPAGEWLLDNFYLIEEQVIIARKHLPKGYSEGLPCLSAGISSGLPRVYDIVLEIISHSDGRVDVKSLSSFVTAYQTSGVLTLGELWALPIMLRLAVIENLRRIAGKVALDMIDHNLAAYWAARMITTVAEDPGALILVIADMARSGPALESPFVAGLTRELQGKGPGLALPLSWMEQQLFAAGVSSNDLVRQENQKQATDQVSVRNSIGTLRFLEATEWREFVELQSSMEHVLQQDIAGIYPLMDFATRDRYRHVVEAIAKSGRLTETEVAQKAIDLCAQHKGNGETERSIHVGYYLIDKGLEQLKQATGPADKKEQKALRLPGSVPVWRYLLYIALLTVTGAAIIWYRVYNEGAHSHLFLLLMLLLAISGAAQLAVSLVNWLATISIQPRLLPRMDFSEGIPESCITLIVVPTMLTDKNYIDDLLEALEIRFLANREPNLYFGLLTDFPDAEAAVLPGDDELLTFASQGIQALNLKYPRATEDTFFLFHRPRTWNARERKWMGYERKRGKLSALNALLSGHGRDEFALIIGDQAVLTSVKYVITLDSDTQLPRDAVWKFVATMAHPLNRPVYDPLLKRITSGYGILQPRMAAAIPKAASLYLRMQGNISGIDPYTRVSSDVYQDLFSEGSFIGKGIYDVAVFEQTLHETFEENRILSHDLLEGCYTRSGLLSDVLLYEEHPAQYSSEISRRHRWIRGDWQIGAWMLPFVTGYNRKLTRNRLSLLSRWKILDNLRRSLLPLSLLVMLLAGWTVLSSPWFWTAAVTLIMLLQLMAATGWQLIHKPDELSFKAHIYEVGFSTRDILLRFMFDLAVLPYEALVYTDAIVRTNWRMIVTRKHLLEWTPSAVISRNKSNNILSVYTSMWISPVAAIVCAAVLCAMHPAAVIVALPVLILWLIAPALVWRLSLPEKEDSPDLTPEQTQFLHQTARKTWAFFEQFVTAADNWLPPDNFQEQPIPVIAHRTSPTNMGLALLANLTAYDFGYISGGLLAARSRDTLQAMLGLQRDKGHFYNWYDTLTLQPMPPRYISTVDSGNLAGHLLTLRQGLLALPDQPVFSQRIFKGIRTTIGLLYPDLPKGHMRLVAEQMITILDASDDKAGSLSDIKKTLDRLLLLITDLATYEGQVEPDTRNWINRLSLQVNDIMYELLLLMPWMSLLPAPAHLILDNALDEVPSLSSVSLVPAILLPRVTAYLLQDLAAADRDWLHAMYVLLQQENTSVTERISLLASLAAQCEELSDMTYDFLLNKSTGLLSIGYNAETQRLDDSYYDLLASEVRLGIFVGIAQGKLPQESWFALGRLLTNSGGEPILLSWSGSMFEYLMPQLVMPVYENTLLHQTNKATVKRQIEYGSLRNIPWGISESAYNMVDANMNYQYRAFGVPGLGLKRGLEEDLVIAPYATMMALMVMPEKACANLQLLSLAGFEGEFGFYEAIDYTPARLPRGKPHSLIQSFMVHHQGMGFLSLSYLLLGKPMQQRFVSELRFQATLLLLQERIPRTSLFYAHTTDFLDAQPVSVPVPVRSILIAGTPIPEIQLLSNGRYQVMITNSGGGYSRWKDIAVTRWREDTTKDNHGIFCYIRDTVSGHFWSNTHQPVLQTASSYGAVFSQGHVEFYREDYGIETKTEIVISPEDDVEMRRVRITNKTASVRILDVTSYAEVVMAAQAADEAHPAFSNLFVQTEIIPEHHAVLCTRRPRSEQEVPPWMFHLMDVRGATVETVSYETDRMAFIGRGQTLASPRAMQEDLLSGKQGAVLDPILSVRHRISIKPGHTATIDLIYGISEARETSEVLIHKYKDQHLKNRAFELSWTHSQVLMRQINTTESDIQLYDCLAASVIYANPMLRADAATIQNNLRGQSGLWSHSVSGDLPIVLLHISDTEHIGLVRQLLQAHAYWRLKGLAVDLVIWNEDYGSYRQLLQEQILGLITADTGNSQTYNKPGNIFVRSADLVSAEDRILFESVARVVIHDHKGSLSEQVGKRYPERILPPLLVRKPVTEKIIQHELRLPEDLLYFNGIGGFSTDGKTYKILTNRNAATPAPWANVIANPVLGTVVSESGSAYTWALNAHEYRITPWNNDPVSDTNGEAFYLRDEDTGDFWSPSPFPATGTGNYITTHGFGYSIFEHTQQGIASEMYVFVDKEQPVKFIVLNIRNRSGIARKLSATGFLEMILGDVRSKTNMYVVSEQDTASGALLCSNRYNTAFSERVSYFKVNNANAGFTGDRAEFIGRNRDIGDPQALYRKKLSGRTGGGMDPCAALQVHFDLLDGADLELIFQIGSGENRAAALDLIRLFQASSSVWQAFNDVKEYWVSALDAIQVSTPDKALNVLANGWLQYQTIASRLFGRSGFYQSGGAFGFRDQLQDVLSLLETMPSLARGQLLLSASRQFVEGDVQHWWHPPEGRGVRTHCADDLLWLPFVVSRYVAVTGDKSILDETAGFLESRLLHPGEDSLYDLPANSNQTGTVYEHCVRAIEHSLVFGKHGLPLIGSGDWNDGMDQVGNKGLGESVWMAFFLYDVLSCFTPVAEQHQDLPFAAICTRHAAVLKTNIEAEGWDGEWYLRAWFDDGSALGSKASKECRIDALVQSWAVLSGAADEERKHRAMTSLNAHLVKRDMKLIQLLDPPFDNAGPNPGYIKGYVPGVRENGGQYSHAAIWSLMAFAALGDRETTWELFSMINPINHTADAAGVNMYKVEPYVLAADVYANEAQPGRGGWTWYTGSAGWMYQFITGSLLGMKLSQNQLTFNPCFPLEWPLVAVVYRFGKATYHITIYQSADINDAFGKVDGIHIAGNILPLQDDDREHEVSMYIPAKR